MQKEMVDFVHEFGTWEESQKVYEVQTKKRFEAIYWAFQLSLLFISYCAIGVASFTTSLTGDQILMWIILALPMSALGAGSVSYSYLMYRRLRF